MDRVLRSGLTAGQMTACVVGGIAELPRRDASHSPKPAAHDRSGTGARHRSRLPPPGGVGTIVNRAVWIRTMRGLAEGMTVLVGILVLSACAPRESIVDGFGDDARKLRVVNREATKVPDRNGVRLSRASGNGVAWVEGSDFRSGTIELDIRGESFVGVAFHGKDNNTYEAVYLRPFNFRATDLTRKQHAVQYIALPEFDWPRLRKEFPEEFENPVDDSIVPDGWIKLRVVVGTGNVQIYVGPVKASTLEVRKLGQLDGGKVGLWVGNGSGGDFANLVVTPTK